MTVQTGISLLTFIIKNIRKTSVPVGTVLLQPGEQLEAEVLNDAINDAADRGDISVTDATETPAERKADADAIEEGVEAMDKIVGEK